jgi:hypothetical protein
MNSWDDYVLALESRWPAWYQYRLQLQFSDLVQTKLQLSRFGVMLPPSTTETENLDG